LSASVFVRKSKLFDEQSEEFFDFRKPSGNKIENEATKEELFGTFSLEKVHNYSKILSKNPFSIFFPLCISRRAE
jgi:hypothetical protein